MKGAIDLTTLAGDVLPPADKGHEIFQGPISHATEIQSLDMQPERMALRLIVLEGRVSQLEGDAWPIVIAPQKQNILPTLLLMLLLALLLKKAVRQ